MQQIKLGNSVILSLAITLLLTGCSKERRKEKMIDKAVETLIGEWKLTECNFDIEDNCSKGLTAHGGFGDKLGTAFFTENEFEFSINLVDDSANSCLDTNDMSHLGKYMITDWESHLHTDGWPRLHTYFVSFNETEGEINFIGNRNNEKATGEQNRVRIDIQTIIIQDIRYHSFWLIMERD